MHEEWRRNKYGGLFKVTNDYMNKKIRGENTEETKEEDLAYHYGDGGKARDTYYWHINSSNRSTGHFGTGTYFVSKDVYDYLEKNPQFNSRNDRPRKNINFNDYDLYKPKLGLRTEAETLHEGLKAVNYENFNSFDFEHMKIDMIANGIPSDKIDKAVNKVKAVKTTYDNKGYNDDYESNQDSLSTVFMKELGFNGIDVRNIDGYDNMGYGSVIYDLNKKRK